MGYNNQYNRSRNNIHRNKSRKNQDSFRNKSQFSKPKKQKPSNDILSNIPANYSLNASMKVGNKINQILGNNIITQIKEAWKEEV